MSVSPNRDHDNEASESDDTSSERSVLALAAGPVGTVTPNMRILTIQWICFSLKPKKMPSGIMGAPIEYASKYGGILWRINEDTFCLYFNVKTRPWDVFFPVDCPVD